MGRGKGASKKEAQQAAAADALSRFKYRSLEAIAKRWLKENCQWPNKKASGFAPNAGKSRQMVGTMPFLQLYGILFKKRWTPPPSQAVLNRKLAVASRPVKLNEVKLENTPRILTRIDEFDRLIGGGIVPGSLTLVGGDPGIGKSTLLLQLSHSLGQTGSDRPLYLRRRIGRTDVASGQPAAISKPTICCLLCETNFTLHQKPYRPGQSRCSDRRLHSNCL